MANYYAKKFFDSTQVNLKQSAELLGANCLMSTTPFYSMKYHGVSLLYPVAHSVHAIRDLIKIAQGAFLLTHALFNEPKTSVSAVFNGMITSIGSLVCNCLNTALSLMSFVTRTLSTVFCLGYSSSTIDGFCRQNAGREMTGKEGEATLHWMSCIALGLADQTMKSTEEMLAATTFSM